MKKKLNKFSALMCFSLLIGCGQPKKRVENSETYQLTANEDLATKVCSGNSTEIKQIVKSKQPNEALMHKLCKKLQNPTYRKEVNKVQLGVGRDYLGSGSTRNIGSIPTKLMLWNNNVGGGTLSEADQLVVKAFIVDNNIEDIKVSINQHDPLMVLRRTLNNKETALPTKAVGLIQGLLYTLTFGKWTGITGDHYNAASNSVHLYSNDINIALHELGHAKDFNQSDFLTWKDPTGFLWDHKMTYTLLKAIFPPIVLLTEYYATKYALDYLDIEADKKAKEDALNTLVPAYGSYIAQSIGAILGLLGVKQFFDSTIIHKAKMFKDPAYKKAFIAAKKSVSKAPFKTKMIKKFKDPKIMLIIAVVVAAHISVRAWNSRKDKESDVAN